MTMKSHSRIKCFRQSNPTSASPKKDGLTPKPMNIYKLALQREMKRGIEVAEGIKVANQMILR